MDSKNNYIKSLALNYLDDVHWCGYKKDIDNFWSSIDIAILPAREDEAFGRVVPRQGDMEKAHVSFNKFVEDNIQHALYRDWPDNLNNTKLTETPKQFTIKEIVEATKRVDSEIWKK